jgi:hypothetical protein
MNSDDQGNLYAFKESWPNEVELKKWSCGILYGIQDSLCDEGGVMPVRLNITMDEDVYEQLKRDVPPKRLSAFITTAVREKLHPGTKALDAAYRAASREKWRKQLSEDWKKTDVEGWPT